MAITTVIGALATAQPVLERLSQIRQSSVQAWRLSRALRVVSEQLKEYHTERLRLISEMGVKREPTAAEAAVNGGGLVGYIPIDKMQEFLDALSPIVMSEVEVNCSPLPISDLGEVSAQEIMALGQLVSAPEESDGR